MAVGYVASATSGSQASVASFNISASLGTGARAGIVFVVTHASSTAKDTGVTWNGVSMTLLYSAADTDTEPGIVRAYFLDNVTNGAVTVTRTNDAVVTVGYAASISASGATEVAQTITRVSSTQNTNANTSTTGTGASGEIAVDDGSLSGTNSMRFAAYWSGAATPPAAGTNSTSLFAVDGTAYGSRAVRETTAGTGSRSVGAATGTTDDWAIVAVAVREKVRTLTLGLLESTPALYAPTIIPDQLVTLPLLESAGFVPDFDCGFECATISTDWGEIGGPHTRDTTVSGRTGVAAARIDITADTTNRIIYVQWGNRSVTVARFRFKVDTLPVTNDVRVMKLNGVAVYDPNLYIGAADSRLHFSAGSTNATGPVIAINTWYTVALAVDGLNKTAHWSVDGVAQSDPGAAGSTDQTNGLYLGKSDAVNGGAFSIWFDDVAYSANWSDYPVADGYVNTSDAWVNTAVAPALFAPVVERLSGGTTQTLTIPLLTETAALYAPTVLPQPVGITIGLLESTPALYAPTVTPTNTLTLALLDAGPDLYAPSLGHTITLGLLTSTSALYQPTLVPKNAISLDLIDAGPDLFAPTILPTNTITLGLLDAAPALYAPDVIGAQFLTLPLLDASPDLFAPTVVNVGGLQTLTIPLLDAGPALYAPALTLAPYPITVPLLDSTPALYQPTITPKNTITLGQLDATAALYAPTIIPGAVAIIVPLLDGGSALFAPTVAQGQAITLGLLDGSNALYAPTLYGYVPIVLPLLDGAGELYAPTLQNVAVFITGITRDSNGTPLGSVEVHVFRTSDDVEVAQVTSNGLGVFSIQVQAGVAHYIVAYKTGTPDRAGTTLNTLVGS